MQHPAAGLDGLKIVDPDDFGRYKTAVEAGRPTGWGYYFPYLLVQNRPGKTAVLLGEDDGSVCIFRWQVRDSRERLDVYLPPVPLSVPALARCLERANDFNGDRSARVIRIDAGDVPALAAIPGLRLRPRREQYLFKPADYDDLGGRKFRTIRRNIEFVDRLPGVEVEPYSPLHAEGCTALLTRWKKAHREAHGTAGGAGSSRRTIELAGRLPERALRGEVVLLDGEVAAFAFGGEIRTGLGCAFERKADGKVRGLSYYHFRSLLQSLGEFDLVNDGSDTGRPGLRQLKDSFRPAGMHTEYRGTQQATK